MNACSVKTLLVTAATTVMMIVGCASADPTEDEVLTGVETGDVDQKLVTGATISSSSGVIGGVGGTIVKLPPGSTNPPQPPVSCGDYCTPAGDGCACPHGYGYASTITCPYSAPIARYVLGVWRCYAL